MSTPFQTPGRFKASDFKEMLKTPSRGPAAASAATPVTFGGKRGGGGAGAAGKEKREKKPKKKDATAAAADGSADGESAAAAATPGGKGGWRGAPGETPYRNRAAERAKGLNPDYADDNKLLKDAGLTSLLEAATPVKTGAYNTPMLRTPVAVRAQHAGIVAKEGAIPNPEAEDPDKIAADRQRNVKEEIVKSKFLGGDLKHTHLVKGVDEVLYQKEVERIGELEAKKAREAEERKRQLAEKFVLAAKNDFKAETADGAALVFGSTLGRSVYEAAKARQATRCVLTPGRTVFTFAVHGDTEDDIPQMSSLPSESSLSKAKLLESRVSAKVLQAIGSILLGKGKGEYDTMKQRKHLEKERKARQAREAQEREVTRSRLAGTGIHIIGSFKAGNDDASNQQPTEENMDDLFIEAPFEGMFGDLPSEEHGSVDRSSSMMPTPQLRGESEAKGEDGLKHGQAGLQEKNQGGDQSVARDVVVEPEDDDDEGNDWAVRELLGEKAKVALTAPAQTPSDAAVKATAAEAVALRQQQSANLEIGVLFFPGAY
ncbi:hypothetical protein DIPPA_02898 [Diplonema papillatum]|nr:hypothetical protein DIPPA_02898 [Diplonema papillatum]